MANHINSILTICTKAFVHKRENLIITGGVGGVGGVGRWGGGGWVGWGVGWGG